MLTTRTNWPGSGRWPPEPPEGKVAKNRAHVDIDPGPDKAGHVAKLVEAGVRVIDEVDEPTGKSTVPQDPKATSSACTSRSAHL